MTGAYEAVPVNAAARSSWKRLRRPIFLATIHLGDLVIPCAAFALAYYLRFERVPEAMPFGAVLQRPTTQIALLVTVLTHVVLLWVTGLYRVHKAMLPLDFVLRVGLVASVSMLAFHGTAVVVHSVVTSRILAVYLWLLLVTLSMGSRLSARIVVLVMLCMGVGVKKVLLVGHSETAPRLLRALREHPEFGYRVIGVLTRAGGPETPAPEQARPARVRQGTASQMFRRVKEIYPDLVIITGSARNDHEVLDLISECTDAGIEVRAVPDFFEIYSSHMRVERIGNIPMLLLRSPKAHPVASAVKRGVDVFFALLLLPFLVLALLGLKLRAGRRVKPLLVKRSRAGLQGRRFPLYALNEALWTGAPLWLLALPQLFNVLRGEMSLVGPRANPPDRVDHFSSWEKRMLSVRPGIMGFAAVNEAPGRVDPGDQFAWDVEYIDHQSIAFDLNVILAHFPQLLAWRTGVAREAG